MSKRVEQAMRRAASRGRGSGRPLLVGEAPSRGGDRYWMFPVSGNPARVLCTLAGVPPHGQSGPGRWTWALYDRFECRNLLERYPGAQGRGAAFPMGRAREAAAAMRGELPAVVVLLGRRVAEAFGVRPDFYEWFDLDRGDGSAAQAVVCHHPSGLNRALNGEEARGRLGGALRRAMRLATGLPPLERV